MNWLDEGITADRDRAVFDLPGKLSCRDQTGAMNNSCFQEDGTNRVEILTREIAREKIARHAAERIYKKQSEILDQALTAIDEARTLDKVTETILRANADLLGADGLSFWRSDPGSDAMILQMMYAHSDFYTDEMLAKMSVPRRIPRADAPTWPALQKRCEPFPVYDIAADTRVTHKPQILAQHVKVMLIVPLLSNRRLIGWSSAFYLKKREIGADDIALAQALAQQATFAVELISLADSGRVAARSAAQQALPKPLTQQEIEVLSWLGEGKSNQEVADILYIEISTVKVHVTHILNKLEVTSRGQAVNKARQLGLIK